MLFEHTCAIWAHIALIYSNSTRSSCDLLQYFMKIFGFGGPTHFDPPNFFKMHLVWVDIRVGKIDEHSDIHSYYGSLGQNKEEKCCIS